MSVPWHLLTDVYACQLCHKYAVVMQASLAPSHPLIIHYWWAVADLNLQLLNVHAHVHVTYACACNHFVVTTLEPGPCSVHLASSIPSSLRTPLTALRERPVRISMYLAEQQHEEQQQTTATTETTTTEATTTPLIVP